MEGLRVQFLLSRDLGFFPTSDTHMGNANLTQMFWHALAHVFEMNYYSP
jgi:hypothetical protein